MGIKDAIKELAGMANLPFGDLSGPELQKSLAVRTREDVLIVAVQLFQRWLFGYEDKQRDVKIKPDAEALAYARSRGWTDETIIASRLGFSGRGTSSQMEEMRDEFTAHGIDPESPAAVIVLGYKGDVMAWAKKYELDPQSFKEKGIHGLMGTPGLVFAHKCNGRISYLSRRQLPGYDVIRNHETGEENEWKSFNPYTALAGEKIPYFNHLHLRDHTKIVIVEGQADAITMGQWGIPAMALCGSQWKNLGEHIETLTRKDKEGSPVYETIYFASDSDTPGETIVKGRKNDFPLTSAFGPMLWVLRLPKFKWIKNGKEKIGKDANDLSQYHLDEKISAEVQADNVRNIFDKAEPIVLIAALYAGRQQGAERQKALDMILPLIARMPTNAHNDMRMKLAKALFPEDLFPEYKGAFIHAYSKLLDGELKDNKDQEDKPFITEEIIGGWYPINEDGSEGYLLEMIYENKMGKAKFAYAHIWLNGQSEREIGVTSHMDLNGKRLVPMIDDNIRFRTVRLPNALGNKKSTRQLLLEIR